MRRSRNGGKAAVGIDETRQPEGFGADLAADAGGDVLLKRADRLHGGAADDISDGSLRAHEHQDKRYHRQQEAAVTGLLQCGSFLLKFGCYPSAVLADRIYQTRRRDAGSSL